MRLIGSLPAETLHYSLRGRRGESQPPAPPWTDRSESTGGVFGGDTRPVVAKGHGDPRARRLDGDPDFRASHSLECVERVLKNVGQHLLKPHLLGPDADLCLGEVHGDVDALSADAVFK